MKIGLIFLFLVACSTSPLKTVTRATCNSVDWFEIGRRDGTQGLPSQKLSNPNLNCLSSEPDTEAYRLGRERGLLDFCNVKNALMLGRAGVPYHKVCPNDLSTVFENSYDRGLKIFELAQKNEKLSLEIIELSKDLQTPQLSSQQKLIYRIRLDYLENLKKKNLKSISQIESQKAQRL